MIERNGLYFKVILCERDRELPPLFYLDVFDARITVRDFLQVTFLTQENKIALVSDSLSGREETLAYGPWLYQPFLKTRYWLNDQFFTHPVNGRQVPTSWAEIWCYGRRPVDAPLSEMQHCYTAYLFNGRRLQQLRRDANMGQAQAAACAALDTRYPTQMWSNYEKGRVPTPRIKMFEQMAYPFCVHPRELVLNSPPPTALEEGMPESAVSLCRTWKGNIDPLTGAPLPGVKIPPPEIGIRDMITKQIPRTAPASMLEES